MSWKRWKYWVSLVPQPQVSAWKAELSIGSSCIEYILLQSYLSYIRGGHVLDRHKPILWSMSIGRWLSKIEAPLACEHFC